MASAHIAYGRFGLFAFAFAAWPLWLAFNELAAGHDPATNAGDVCGPNTPAR